MNKTQLKALVASYVRSVLGAAVALYLSGVTDPGKLALSLVAALVPVATRALNPKDKAFGIVPSVAVVDAALSKAKTANTKPIVDGVNDLKKLIEPAKKPATKKPVDKKTPPKK
ncbi:hypothetical protein UFOVP222_82 [uncultured Caudovirales phage]|uniref:Uncharacterized protein n=1 Tax=uncultured Caudovirales phage TaxID=2100421 RepID=A0A6J7WTU3_9CAUD|nr:hypothetical protein UFOVP108_77 [uncultured Caudovirales phage]CAB5219514.1 hypothetical protein UFOVP222_82 [uncultured Caudovirales phage]